MKMIKVTNKYKEDVYINVKGILSVKKHEYLDGFTRINLPGATYTTDLTPEQIVAMIHEVEG